jgi:hypothetical protein
VDDGIDLGSAPSGKFFAVDLDDPNQIESVDEIGFCAHAISRRLVALRRREGAKSARFCLAGKTKARNGLDGRAINA